MTNGPGQRLIAEGGSDGMNWMMLSVLFEGRQQAEKAGLETCLSLEAPTLAGGC